MFKRYALTLERAGVLVAPVAGALKIDEAAGLAILDFGTATPAQIMALAGLAGIDHVSIVDGADETSTHAIAVTGMAVGDEIVAVIVLTTKASIVSAAAHAGTLTAASGAITPGTEVNNTGNQYVIFWRDLTP